MQTIKLLKRNNNKSKKLNKIWKMKVNKKNKMNNQKL